MLKKKFFAKALAFALVMGTVSVYGGAAAPISIVQAGSSTASNMTIEVDYSTFEATLTIDGDEKYVCLQVLKDSQGSKVSSEIWYPVDTQKAVVDLSFLKATKPSYLRIRTSTGVESAITTVNAQPKKISIKYDAVKKEFLDGKTKLAIAAADLPKYEYKTLYGSYWGTITASSNAFASSTLDSFIANKLDSAIKSGTTLVIRKKAVTTGEEAPASPEVKIKIPAIAKAPKVKVTYEKGKIQLPKGVEIAVLGAATLTDDDFRAVEGSLTPTELLKKAGVTEGNIDQNIYNGYTIVVRTKATTKKPASNMAFVTINSSPVLQLETSNKTIKAKVGSGTANTSKIVYEMNEKDIKLTVSPDTTSPANTYTFSYSLDGKKWITLSTGATTVALEDGAKIKFRVAAVKENTLTKTKGAFESNEIELEFKSTPSTGG